MVKVLLGVCAVLGLAVWVARLAWGQDEGGGGLPKQARGCSAKSAVLRVEFEEIVSAHNQCKKSSDCEVLQPGCPFGCYVAVAKTHLWKVSERADELAASAGHECRCKYRCRVAPRAVCVHGTCMTKERRARRFN